MIDEFWDIIDCNILQTYYEGLKLNILDFKFAKMLKIW